MKASERNEKNDRATAWMVTILVHAALLAALLFVGMPDQPSSSVSKPGLDQKVVIAPVKSKA